MGEKSWEERGTKRASAREREREVPSHVQDQKVKRQISLLSHKEASPSERGVRRLRNRRKTLLLWWFKGDMTSLSSLKSQLVSDSVSQLWREFLLSGAWLCSVDCSQKDLQQKRGSRAGAGTKVSSSPLWPADPNRNFCWEVLSREHGWIYDFVLRILDEQFWRHVSLTFSSQYLTGKIKCDSSVMGGCENKNLREVSSQEWLESQQMCAFLKLKTWVATFKHVLCASLSHW